MTPEIIFLAGTISGIVAMALSEITVLIIHTVMKKDDKNDE